MVWGLATVGMKGLIAQKTTVITSMIVFIRTHSVTSYEVSQRSKAKANIMTLKPLLQTYDTSAAFF